MEYQYNRLTFKRRKTREVMVGHVAVGGDNPIRIQSMTIADTLDTEATVQETIKLAEAGCEIVRITAPSIKEAENLKNIKAELLKRGVNVPLVADIHFTPNAALIAADYVEKVRINPGNYADRKRFEQYEYSDEEYAKELERIEARFKPLVLKCKELGRAMRIGTNHGSLSDRIMNRYGDTAEGMVESALEFLHICRRFDYHDIILSMKSSNPLVAIQAYRLLAARMDELGMDYPFHLGVTEAGDGQEGRIKSAIGIGGLLEDGIGDTIRVSLTEDAIAEVPVAQRLAERYNKLAEECNGAVATLPLNGQVQMPNPFQYERRETLLLRDAYHKIGGQELPRAELTLFSALSNLPACLTEIRQMLAAASNGSLSLVGSGSFDFLKTEVIHVRVCSSMELEQFQDLRRICLAENLFAAFAVHVHGTEKLVRAAAEFADRLVLTETQIETGIEAGLFYGCAVECVLNEADDDTSALDLVILQIMETCQRLDFWNVCCSLSLNQPLTGVVKSYRYLAGRLDKLDANLPLVLRFQTDGDSERDLLNVSAQIGVLFCDGIGDSLHIVRHQNHQETLGWIYSILQATRLRISKTDYISCPSCGRTLFDLQATTERIKAKTSHLKGVKIAIMGCIVNGPGEMADADFGYVGSGPKVINLFVGKECVKRNIPEAEADQKLIELIKEHGKWVDAGG